MKEKKLYMVLPSEHPLRETLGTQGVGYSPVMIRPPYRPNTSSDLSRDRVYFCGSVKDAVRDAVANCGRDRRSASEIEIITAKLMDDSTIDQRRKTLINRLADLMGEVMPDGIGDRSVLWSYDDKLIPRDALVIEGVIPEDVVQALIDIEMDKQINSKAGVTGSSFILDGMYRMLKSIEEEVIKFEVDPVRNEVAKKIMEKAQEAIKREQNKSDLAGNLSKTEEGAK